MTGAPGGLQPERGNSVVGLFPIMGGTPFFAALTAAEMLSSMGDVPDVSVMDSSVRLRCPDVFLGACWGP